MNRFRRARGACRTAGRVFLQVAGDLRFGGSGAFHRRSPRLERTGRPQTGDPSGAARHQLKQDAARDGEHLPRHPLGPICPAGTEGLHARPFTPLERAITSSSVCNPGHDRRSDRCRSVLAAQGDKITRADGLCQDLAHARRRAECCPSSSRQGSGENFSGIRIPSPVSAAGSWAAHRVARRSKAQGHRTIMRLMLGKRSIPRGSSGCVPEGNARRVPRRATGAIRWPPRKLSGRDGRAAPDDGLEQCPRKRRFHCGRRGASPHDPDKTRVPAIT